MPDHIPPSPERDTETMKLICCLFQQMREADGTTHEKAVEYTPEYFLQWFRNKANVMEIVEEDALAASKAQPVAWEFLTEIAHSWAGPAMIAPLWPMVTMAYRGEPKHPVACVHVNYIVAWKDGKRFIWSSQIPAALMTGGVITDGFAAAKLADQFRALRHQFSEAGLDQIHDDPNMVEDMGGDAAYEQTMGTLLHLIKQHPEAEKVRMMKWFRFIQMAVRPPIPKPAQPQPQASLPQPLPGGFDS